MRLVNTIPEVANMYTEDELNSLNRQIRTRWIAWAVPAVILLGLQIYSVVIRQEPMTIALGILICFFSIFFIGTQIVPLHRYRTHMDSMLHGRTHTVEAVYRSMDADESMVAGVRYRAMHVECSDEKGDPYERLFYWDMEKPDPGFTDGTRLIITYHDREIAAIETV